MEVSLYHSVLRVTLVVLAGVLVFDGGFISPLTKKLSDNTIQYLASGMVGVVASVPQNELNEFTAELTARERALDAREAVVSEREIAARDFGGGEPTDYSTYVLSIILFMLTTLILFNYYLDWRRMGYRRV